MARQNKLRRLCRKRRDVAGNVIASDMSMDDVDPFFAGELRDLHSTQNAERVSDRNMEEIFLRKEVEAVLPVASRSQRDEHVMAALLKAAAQIDDMALGPAVISGR